MTTPTSEAIVIISGPSGSGQDTVIHALQEVYDFARVTNTTSRPPRPGEVNGKDYHFISTQEFEIAIENGKLLEWKLVYDQYKGIMKEDMERALASGKPTLLKLDWQGVITIKNNYPRTLAVGLKVEDPEILQKRIETRGQDTKGVMEKRMRALKSWRYDVYDFVVLNQEGQLTKTIAEIQKHINAFLQK